jgi:hypothetical protein
MTYSEFRSTLVAELLSTAPTVVIINYNTVGGVTTIDDIAILIENNLAQLQEATIITLSIPQLNGVKISINVEPSTSPVRRVDRGIVGKYFCYSILTPAQRPVMPVLPATTPEEYFTDVVIEPITSAGSYNYNVYNPLIGNTIVDRESSYRVQSDRGTLRADTKTNPVNIESILSDDAVPATVQDSLYSDTGWIQARYEGTKLTPLNNSNVDPVLPGTFFEGAFFGLDIEDIYITGLSTTDIVFTQYLSSGKSQVPQFEIEDLGLSLITTSPGLTGTLLRTRTPSTLTSKFIPFTIGDLLVVSSSVKIEREVMLMEPPITTQQYFPYELSELNSGLESKDIRVLRGYADTPKYPLTQNYPDPPLLYRLSKVKLYGIEGTVVQAVNAGKILVRETGEILYVSAEGLVVGGNTMVVV